MDLAASVFSSGRVKYETTDSYSNCYHERTQENDRYGMPEVYAFSTDFPHPEGGTDPIGRMGADIEPLGEDAVEAFFVGNAELLLPD